MKLKEICEYISDRVAATAVSEENYISTENMVQNKGGVIRASSIPSSGAVIRYKNDDILISNIRPYFKKIWHADKTGGCSADVLCIRAKEHIDRTFLYYLLSQDAFFEYVMTGAKGCKMPRGDKGHIMDWEIDIPEDKSEQTAIGQCLKVIDKKIELNRQINDNLEQQAQALYKSWFVDFEPFSEEEFIESSLGLIPAGWKVGQLSDICEIVGGGTPSKSHPEYYCSSGIAWITPKDLSVSKSKFSSRGSEDITEEGYKNSSAKLMPRGTVLFSSRAPIGYISIATNEICTNQGFKSAIPGIAGTGYLYYFLQANTDKIESKASGSTFKEASGSLMKSLEVIIPADGIFNQFEAELAPILTKQENIATEIQTLTTLRDTLLPKLMSGELKINEIDC